VQARIAVVILNYRTPQLVNDCLASLAPEIEDGIEVVVVDNASGDGSADAIESEIDDKGWGAWARILRSPVNGGFAAGNNLGIRATDADAYLLLNSDTIVRPGALRELRRAFSERPDAGLIGPQLEERSGSRDASTFRFIGPLTELVQAARTGPITRLLPHGEVRWQAGDTPFEPDWIGFACVLVRREVVDQVGMLDEGFFMYFEDIDYCRRVRGAGWRILYWPAARVVHLLGGSSQVTNNELRRAPRYFYEGRSRYFRKYFGLTGLWRANLCWLAGRTVSLLRERAGNKAPHTREKQERDIWIDSVHWPFFVPSSGDQS
jgi:hypothetical protein